MLHISKYVKLCYEVLTQGQARSFKTMNDRMNASEGKCFDKECHTIKLQRTGVLKPFSH